MSCSTIKMDTPLSRMARSLSPSQRLSVLSSPAAGSSSRRTVGRPTIALAIETN